MSVKEIYQNRYSLAIEALLLGLEVEFKNEWNIFYSNGQLFQSYYSKEDNKNIVHKSEVSLQSFLQKFESCEIQEIKKIYSNIKLASLQNKLLKLE